MIIGLQARHALCQCFCFQLLSEMYACLVGGLEGEVEEGEGHADHTLVITMRHVYHTGLDFHAETQRKIQTDEAPFDA